MPEWSFSRLLLVRGKSCKAVSFLTRGRRPPNHRFFEPSRSNWNRGLIFIKRTARAKRRTRVLKNSRVRNTTLLNFGRRLFQEQVARISWRRLEQRKHSNRYTSVSCEPPRYPRRRFDYSADDTFLPNLFSRPSLERSRKLQSEIKVSDFLRGDSPN